MKRLLLIILVLLVSASYAADKTPYNFAVFGNIYNTGGGVTDFKTNDAYIHWLNDRFDMVLNGEINWLKDVRDLDTSTPTIWVGPYASVQEINLYVSAAPETPLLTRLADTTNQWLYVFAKSYLEDTVSVPVESLVVHCADDAVTISQDIDGSRAITNIQSLNPSERRFTYQAWNNTSADTFAYPAGYVWLANGWNVDAQNAIASAFYRAFVTEPTTMGWHADEWDCYYMDNHARRNSFMSYWSLTTSSGGKDEDYLEWIEGDTLPIRLNGGDYVTASEIEYFDNAVLKIDSTINSRLMSGGHSVRGFANIYSTWPNDLPPLLPHVAGVTFESPIDYTQSWPNVSLNIASYDTLANYPSKFAFFEYRGDFLCQPSGWLSDTSRVIMYGYNFFLLVRSDSTFFAPHEVHQGDFGGDRRCWQDAFYIDLGTADSVWRKLDSTGSAYTKTMAMYRSYGDNAVILRTSHSTADYTDDSILVDLVGSFYEVDGWTGDTAETSQSTFYLKPYDSKMLVGEAGAAEPSGSGKRIKFRK